MEAVLLAAGASAGTAATVSTVMSTVGTVVSALGAISQGNARAKAGEYNAAVAERNATIARQQASANEAAQRREASRAIGAMRAGYAANGLSLRGSPLDVLESSAMNAELDALNVRYAGELKAMGYESSAELDRVSASTGRTQGYLRATAVLMGGAAGSPISLDDKKKATGVGLGIRDYGF